ncbi:MAG: DUF1345 domain-containing protein [Shinella sp.]|nr:DUF1345 domain-containing protein [Shinella sp.]
MPKAAAKPMHGRHGPFYAGIIAATVALPICLWLKPSLSLEITASVFFLVYLLLTARRLPMLTAHHLRSHAIETDEPAPVIFAVTFAAVATSLASLFAVMNRDHAPSVGEIVLAFASVALGWLTIHTMAALHYAHLYWRPAETEEVRSARRGLSFPETKEPGAYDFLYFAFIIGMTAQTSDIAINTTEMRKINLLHAVVSFFFNTVLVAAAVNAAVSLAQ